MSIFQRKIVSLISSDFMLNIN